MASKRQKDDNNMRLIARKSVLGKTQPRNNIKKGCTLFVTKTKALLADMPLFANAKRRLSRNVAHFLVDEGRSRDPNAT